MLKQEAEENQLIFHALNKKNKADMTPDNTYPKSKSILVYETPSPDEKTSDAENDTKKIV